MAKKDFLQQKEYSFLQSDPHLGKNIMLLGYGGSHAYGTNVPGSDIDIRGFARPTAKCVLGTDRFDQYENRETDTVIYSVGKGVELLANCNPNVVEILGLRKEDYFYMDAFGKELVFSADMFFSKRAEYSFGGYATAQLRRLQNALAHDAYPQAEKNRHILGSLENAMHTFNERYNSYYDVHVRLNDKGDIVVDMNVSGYPLRDAYGMFSEMRAVVREYDKLNHRNTKKDDAHLNKHAMHLVRLLVTGEELLRTGKMHTYREKEHSLLMAIRGGAYQNDDHTFKSEFFELVDKYEADFKYAAKHTVLPEKPDMERINSFVEAVNTRAVLDMVNRKGRAWQRPLAPKQAARDDNFLEK